MRRADRLFQIIQLLRRRRTATTATHIAERLGVSERTIYRDVRDLILAGTPIDGEAGVGYRIRPGYDLPPLMFDRDEIQALVLGARIVRQVGDPALGRCPQRRARGAHRASQAAAVVRERERRRVGADRASTRPLFLGTNVDARGVVRAALRFPELPARSRQPIDDARSE